MVFATLSLYELVRLNKSQRFVLHEQAPGMTSAAAPLAVVYLLRSQFS